ncbi:NrfD/PsrC family molybdoenzyme membrane anchor subunit [uncultured Adlercreutzia sp.]|uniref:NrfD/PsrC family molybdoenzyme membrane anchor subunit n=1 Tax=uncultured Adlercreutzia sp. TaxID=875803 RepID=UPI0026775C32|nr:NrfD/PsrC family molybdoenzyme membrane anchor subunit [uncultured Adlercreutzia sp.]
MFGELVAAYLFLAGVGAGGIAAASLADLLFVKAPFGAAAESSVAEAPAAERLVSLALAAALGALAMGVGCLAADLGRIDRVLALFLTPVFTLMNVGAWALAGLLAVGAVLVLGRFAYLPWLSRCAVTMLEVAAVVLSVVVAVYAGLLLQGLAGVRLWASPWVPVLFVLSAASCGCVLFAGCSLFVEADGRTVALGHAILRVDAAVVVAEAAAAALFLGGAVASGHPGVVASVASLSHGTAALPWWGGFALCGLAAPLAIEGALWVRERKDARLESAAPARAGGRGPAAAPAPAFDAPPAVLAALALVVLVGGAGLRWAVVEAGAQRPLELQSVEDAAEAEPIGFGRPDEAAGAAADGEAAATGCNPASSQKREDLSLWSS